VKFKDVDYKCWAIYDNSGELIGYKNNKKAAKRMVKNFNVIAKKVRVRVNVV
jgi:hypothetical protein